MEKPTEEAWQVDFDDATKYAAAALDIHSLFPGTLYYPAGSEFILSRLAPGARAPQVAVKESLFLLEISGCFPRNLRTISRKRTEASMHYKTPSLGPSLGPMDGLGGVPWWDLALAQGTTKPW